MFNIENDIMDFLGIDDPFVSVEVEHVDTEFDDQFSKVVVTFTSTEISNFSDKMVDAYREVSMKVNGNEFITSEYFVGKFSFTIELFFEYFELDIYNVRDYIVEFIELVRD